MRSILLRAAVLLISMSIYAQEKGFHVFAKALYWYTSETVDWSHIVTSGTNFVQDDYQTVSFDWNPGFRVGVGYNMCYDSWDTQVAYTWFQTRATDQVTGPVTSGFLAARLSLFEPFQTGKMSLNLHYNMFDWDLGRNCWVSDSLSLRPFIGLKGGWIDQTMHLKWTTPNFIVPGFLYSASEKVKNNFQGGGPQGGVNGTWILGNGNKHVFSLFGHFAGAFMWGHWSLQDKFIDVFSTHSSVPMGDRNFGALMLQAMVGFEWGYYLERNCSHFGLKVGYEIQDWVNHFQVFTNDSGTDNLDLILQGLTLDLHLNF